MRIAALVLALCAGLFGIPAAMCSGFCGAAMGAAAARDSSDFEAPLTQEEKSKAGAAGTAFMCMGAIGAVAYIVGGILVMRPGKGGAIVCAVGSVLTALTLITFNPLSLFVLILGGLATVFAFVKRDPLPVGAA